VFLLFCLILPISINKELNFVYEMKLYLVRHGETHENANGIIQGHINTKLSSLGKNQAKLIASRLKDEKFDFAYSSDLDRCAMTAKEILKFHPSVKLNLEKALREQAKGEFEGMKRVEVFKKSEKPDWWNYPFGGGESMKDVWKRTINFYENIRKKHKDDAVLVVSHGGPITCLLAYLHKQGIIHIGDYGDMENTSISIAKIDNKGGCVFDRLRCAVHLSK